MLGIRLASWSAQINRLKNTGGKLTYHNDRQPATVALMNKAEDGPWDLFTCLNSLRDVETPVKLILYPEFLKQSYD
jgi:hypothetical protein